MKTLIHVSLAAALVLSASSAFTEDYSLDLFNGKSLEGWSEVNDAEFDVHDGALRLVDGMGWLRSDQLYGDFILEFETRALVDDYDSGWFFHAGLEGKPWPDAGWQVNLKTDALGALVRGYRAMLKPETEKVPVGEWMKLRLETEGENASLQINGKEVWQADFIEPGLGLFGIQAENKSFEFRNIHVTEPGFENLLGGEGQNFDSLQIMAGPKVWRLEDGVLICKGQAGGWIGTKTDDYGDFILKLDFNVPKEGNSGVYIRTPANGDGAYTGMEIQVIDDDAKHWGQLQTWQHAGSIYHEVAPSVRATREGGEWQTMCIVARGPEIDIYINGIQIIDENLDEHTTSSSSAPALKDRPRVGYIGFQNHDGDIRYRNVRVKRLD